MKMDEFSVLIGGKAGDGINQSGLLLANLFSQLGYRIYIYFDYPSLIRGGHNFSLIRASKNKIAANKDKIDFLLALSQDTVDSQKERLKDFSYAIYDSDAVKTEGLGLPLTKIIREENAPLLMRNSALLGAFSNSVGIGWDVLERVFRKNISKEIDLNLKLALKGYDAAKELLKIEPQNQKVLPILTGNEAICLGLLKAGLTGYIAYPMTPSSGLLHYFARIADEFGLKVIHPENEIAVMLMALGFSYVGKKCAVGSSGGGFCLMTEGLSLAGMAELPIVIVVAQRAGPSTGIPTYTAQGDLHFVLNAGQGEFSRFVVAPGDARQAFYWSFLSLDISWRYQIPSIILSDKSLSEGGYSLDIDSLRQLKGQKTVIWDRKEPYKRYSETETGVSPLTFVPDKDAVIKVNSYEHDEYGITTEEAGKVERMYKKRLRKGRYLLQELQDWNTVEVTGKLDSSCALVCWGSNKGVCTEIGERLGLKVIQPVVISPFPTLQFQKVLKGVKRIIAVENNATAQLVNLINAYGFNVDDKILKYDGRPFSLDELEKRVKKTGF